MCIKYHRIRNKTQCFFLRQKQNCAFYKPLISIVFLIYKQRELSKVHRLPCILFMYNSLIKVICLHNIGLNYSLNSVMSPICSTKWVSWRHSALHQHPIACATTSQNFPESLSKVGITEGVTYRVDCAIYVTEPVSWNKKK